MTGDSDDTTRDGAPTRREYLWYGGTVVGGGLLAGCAGESDSGSGSTTTRTGTPDATESGTSADPTEETGEADAGAASVADSWTVAMAPRTEVTFGTVPESVVVHRADYADMAVALGRGDAVAGIQDLGSLPEGMLAQLPGVTVDPGGITPLRRDGDYDKEVFYEIDADLHLVDPNNAKRYFGFDEADLSELAANVAPWLGSFIRRPQPSIGPGYPYYTLYEAFERVARVFRERERYAALAAVHDDLLATVAERLPPPSERPSVGLAFLAPGEQFVGSGTFFLVDPTRPGAATKQYRDLGVADAWAEAGVATGERVGYEALLEADPDVLVAHNAFDYTDSTADFRSRVVDVMADDDLGSGLAAVRNDRVYRGGKNVQGPVINLFQTEIAAKQLYPEAFGEWRGLGETPESERLFDRERVAEIITGDFDE
jgi:iron complex transport system substrate-binding protein